MNRYGLTTTLILVAAVGAFAARGLAASESGEAGTRTLALASRGSGKAEILVVREDGKRLRQLTRNGAADYFPVWSPDRRRLAFVSDRDGDDDIYVMDADGRNVRQLTRDRRDARLQDAMPAWSPDGRRIAFASNRTGGELELYMMNADGTNVRRLTRTKTWVMDGTPAWSPDGRLILFATNRHGYFNMELYTMRPDGTGLRRLTRTGGSDGNPKDEGTPEWSPDGSRIAFATNRDRQQEIYVMDADGKNQRRVTRATGRDDILPRWSPDGGTIAYVGTTPAGISSVYLVDAEGGASRKLSVGSDPSWR